MQTQSRDALLAKRVELSIKERTAYAEHDRKVTDTKLTFQQARAAFETAERLLSAAQMAARKITFSYENERHKIDVQLRALNPPSLQRLLNATHRIEIMILSNPSAVTDFEIIHTPMKLAALKAFREWASTAHLLQTLDHDLVVQQAEVLASDLPEFAIEIHRAATQRVEIPA